MESNKLLIGVTFIYIRNKIVDSRQIKEEYEYVMEFIVPRDTTLRQLVDGIKYGLRKKIITHIDAGDTESEDYQRCYICYECCEQCSKYRVGEAYPKITITSFDGAENNSFDNNGRIRITRSDESKKLYELGFLSSTRLVFDTTERFVSIPIVDKESQFKITQAFRVNNGANKNSALVFPNFNISNRQLYKFNKEPVEIIPPSQIPQKPKNSILMSILPSLIMAFSMIMMRSFMPGGGAGMMVMYIGMAVAGLLSSAVMFLFQRRDYKKSLEEWRVNYQNYIDKVCQEIEIRQKNDSDKLNELYPQIHTIIESFVNPGAEPIINGRVFSRGANDDDYLAVRLGDSSEVQSMFEIKGEKRDEVFSRETFSIVEQNEGVGRRTRVHLHLEGDTDQPENISTASYLTNLPHAIAKRYRYLKNTALLFSLKNCSCLGIVSDRDDTAKKFIAKMLFDLCYYHSPEELQIVMLFNRTNEYDVIEDSIKEYKFLPHFRELFNDKSQFVFNSESANLVFGSTLNILSQREGAEQTSPHIVFVIYDEYSLKEHALASYLPKPPKDDEEEKNALGISFIFIKRYKEYLPSYCTDVVTFEGENASITPRNDENKKKVFYWFREYMSACQGKIDQYAYNSYKLLSALVYSRISQNGKVPSGISFFEMCGITAEDMGLKYNWGYRKRTGENKTERVYDITKSLNVPIGKTEINTTCLDLHENADGPHMLVAGTTGSGKSETIISYLLSLCLRFTPEELSLMLVDMKGGGFIKRIGDLPHVVGTVTDVAGDESGTGDEYMVRRFLESLKCEIKRRKLLLNQMRVDSADKYIAACRDIEKHIKTLSTTEGSTGQKIEEVPYADELRRLAVEEKLSHLVLVVDEFTELKRFTSESDDVDFIGEITAIARVGRSLGFHIILVSQNIESAITDDIRVNSRARLCLKVATKQASKEMIGSELAASPTMPGHGRAYLLVGTGTKFVYFQSAYTGTDITESLDVPFEIIEASKTGEYRRFYRSDKDDIENIRKKEEQAQMGYAETQCSAVVRMIKRYFKQNGYQKPHRIFQPPLPTKVTLKNGERYDIK